MNHRDYATRARSMEVYALERPDRPLTPEEIAMAMAKTSRSPNSFRVSAGLVTEESASTFHDKYVLGYGHASVAELASAHACFEGISMLGAKALEDQRLGAYIEASTRYQIWTRDSFVVPYEFGGTEHKELRDRYVGWCYGLFDAYLALHARLTETLSDTTPRPEGMSDGLFKTNIKAKACDLARGLLPAAAMTNVGWSANARVADHTITKLCSHPLVEAVFMGSELKRVAQKQLPTLVKYGGSNAYRMGHARKMSAIAARLQTELYTEGAHGIHFRPYVRLVILDDLSAHVSPAMIELIATALYPYFTNPGWSFHYLQKKLGLMDTGYLHVIWSEIFEGRGERDAAPRCTESAPFIFDMVLDFGSWRDLQRHRMMSQFDQPLTPYHGLFVSDEIAAMGLIPDYCEAIAGTLEIYTEMSKAFGPHVAQYAVPMGFAKRCVFKMNLRQLAAIVELRSKPGGHVNYRRAAVDMWQELKAYEPWMAETIRVSVEGVDDDLKRIKEVK